MSGRHRPVLPPRVDSEAKRLKITSESGLLYLTTHPTTTSAVSKVYDNTTGAGVYRSIPGLASPPPITATSFTTPYRTGSYTPYTTPYTAPYTTPYTTTTAVNKTLSYGTTTDLITSPSMVTNRIRDGEREMDRDINYSYTTPHPTAGNADDATSAYVLTVSDDMLRELMLELDVHRQDRFFTGMLIYIESIYNLNPHIT